MSYVTNAQVLDIRIERISWARATGMFAMMKGQIGLFNQMLVSFGYTLIADDALDPLPVVNAVTSMDTVLLFPFAIFAFFRIKKIRNENYQKVLYQK